MSPFGEQTVHKFPVNFEANTEASLGIFFHKFICFIFTFPLTLICFVFEYVRVKVPISQHV